MVDPFQSATELAAQVRRREVTPSELVEATLARIELHEPRLNAFCHVTADAARTVAREQDARLAAGEQDLPPFFGVPIAIKDLHPVAGWPLCSASIGAAHPVMERDAAAVAALRGAGFVFVGGTTSPEFGTVSVTESHRHGVTRNPWDLGRSPGGSSGGAAAAVAAGVLPIAHGSDGAGSIREPASYCGLVGLKPSRALVPSDIHAMEGLATEGVLTRTVADTAAALDVFAAAPRRSWYVAPPAARSYAESASVDPPRLRIGCNLQPAFPGVDVHPHAAQIGRAAAGLLSDLGHDVRDVRLPGLDPEWFERTFDVLYAAGSADVPIEDEARVEPLNRTLRERARATDALTYIDAVYALQLRSAELIGLWDEIDVMVTPTNPLLAPPEGWQWEGQEDDPWRPLRRAEQTASLTVLGNVLGLPAISIPLFSQPDGMPLGVQLMGRPWQDGTVLSLAGELERARPWHDRRPAGFA
ncbi:amidase [Conexibacter woesei]|uniref:Amidase n=1 Tax=Conexibacter woesei (strain DSM 14684 / CCUG 47730 / CIP 108061 / JCM 11494 / NBRC 100937 / ID131577) TaxID=469383 RepID=D3F5J9_CONWI|nr:amidase [Conexibacter woesei]ADB50666.1 Amidase [Conexibacter woesei DSM 14684]